MERVVSQKMREELLAGGGTSVLLRNGLGLSAISGLKKSSLRRAGGKRGHNPVGGLGGESRILPAKRGEKGTGSGSARLPPLPRDCDHPADCSHPHALPAQFLVCSPNGFCLSGRGRSSASPQPVTTSRERLSSRN